MGVMAEEVAHGSPPGHHKPGSIQPRVARTAHTGPWLQESPLCIQGQILVVPAIRNPQSNPKSEIPLFLRHFSAPRKDLRFRASGFGFLDLAVAIVEERKTGPGDLIVRRKLD